MSRYDKTHFGIKVTLPNGSYEWYDPCDSEPTTSVAGFTRVSTIGHDYEYTVPVKWEKYGICYVCWSEVDSDNWCQMDCPLCEEDV